MSGNATLLSVWSSGIQDISVVATILGTDLCETNLDNILVGGYLYGTSVSLSMFGILAVSKWGIKNALGAERCRSLGLKPSGSTMKSIWSGDYSSTVLVERLDRKYRSKSAIVLNLGWINAWWIMLLLCNTAFALISTIPLIVPFYLDDLDRRLLAFPLISAASLMVAIPFSVLLQLHELLLDDFYISQSSKFHLENTLKVLYNDTLVKGVLILLSFANAVCYVGNYAIIQMASSRSTFYWLVIEACLMGMRLLIWSSNTKHDNPPAIQVDHNLQVRDNDIQWSDSFEPVSDIYERLTSVHGTTEIHPEIKFHSLYDRAPSRKYYRRIEYRASEHDSIMELKYVKRNGYSKRLSDFTDTGVEPNLNEQMKIYAFETELKSLLELATTTFTMSMFYGHMRWSGSILSPKDNYLTMFLEYKDASNHLDPTGGGPLIMMLIERFLRGNRDLLTSYEKYNFRPRGSPDDGHFDT